MTELLPNFLIVGFAKCGTTSLANILSEHKDVFVSKEKELRYFSYEYLKNFGYNGPGDYRPKNRVVKTFEDYKKTFKYSKNFKCIGEATTDTSFYYEKTIPKIKQRLDDPKIIIMLRNPVERSISAYSHLVREEREQLSFEDALSEECQRLRNGYEFIWGYTQASYYFHPVKAFINNFSNVHIVFFEDFISNTEFEIQKIHSFLSLEDKARISQSHFNKSGKPKNKFLNRLLNRKLWVKETLKKIIGNKNALAVKEKIQRKNLRKIVVNDETKITLYNKFKGDITKLEQLLGKDLSHWKQYEKIIK